MTRPQDRPDRDLVVYVAGGFVALVAVLSSFTTLVHLAELAGWDYVLFTVPGADLPVWASHLWAASIDAYGIVALRVWLQSGQTEETRRWAQRDAAGALAVSVVGNVAEHLLTAARVTTLGGDQVSWGLLGVVAVAVVAPVQVARIGHLLILLGRDRSAAGPPAVPTVPAADLQAVQQRAAAAEREIARLVAVLAERDRQDLARDRGDRDQDRQDRDAPAEPDPLLPVAREVAVELAAAGRPLSRTALTTALRARGQGIGTTRATVLLAQLRAA